MKKFLLLMLACIILTGCSQKTTPLDNGPSNIVKNYIESASQGEWDRVIPILSGEALQELQANKERVKTIQKVMSIKTDIQNQTDFFALVNAQVVKSINFGEISYNDIAFYEFRLQKSAGHWFIYHVSPGEIKQPDLLKGTIPVAARDKLKAYLEMPLIEKHEKDYLYLAGTLLANSQKNKESINPKIEPKINVLDIKSAGISEEYVVLEAIYTADIEGYKPVTLTAIADMQNIAGEWKIVQLDIAQIAKE